MRSSHFYFASTRRRLVRTSLASTLALSAVVAFAPAAHATIATSHSYYVGATGDGVAAISQTTCELKTNTNCTLRDAVTWANGDGASSTDTVYLTRFTTPTTFTLDQHSAITISDAGPMLIVGAGTGISTVSGLNATTIFLNSAPAATISNMTITHGSRGFSGNGGAITNNGTLTLVKVNFYENFAGSYGGAVVTSGHLTVHGGLWSRNTANNNCGGALDVFGGVATVDSVTMSDNVSD